DANHEGSSDSKTFSIGKAASVTTVTINGGPFTYTGGAIEPASVSVTGAGGLNLTPEPVYANNVNAGTETASASYTYAGDANHEGSSDSKTFSIGKAQLTVTADDKSKAYDGAVFTAFTRTITGFVNSENETSAGVTGTVTYSGAATTAVNAGSYTITPVVGGLSAANYTFSPANGTLTIAKAALVLTWSDPADIVYGTPLSAEQLNATATVPGDFVYSPTSGTVLNAGDNQILGVTFTPTDTANYNNAAATVSLNVKARPLQLSGTRVYDGTADISAVDLSIVNNLDGANLTLTGTGGLSSPNVGSQAISASAISEIPVRVNSATGAKTVAATGTSFNVTVSTPTNGNTMVAVISTSGATSDRVSSITQTGASWLRAAQSANAGTTTEIWYAPNVSGAGTTVTVNLTATGYKAAAVVMEYSGIMAVNPLDQTASNTNTSASASTGTTPLTVQPAELWIGGIGFADDAPTLSAILDSFTLVDTVLVGGTGADMRVNALERIVNTTGSASSGGTISASVAWSGVIATFKAAGEQLVLSGPAASNYTLAGLSGFVDITPASATVVADAKNKTYGEANPA
ncbi:MAG: hypothetical protein KJ070_09330, partial [Verrucomicrobia bacterium]|nr:hypothetical protein [Verrucomicrobiota bacterium]